MSELNKGIDLNKKSEDKDLVQNLQGTAEKVGNKIENTMESLDEKAKVEKISENKIIKKALDSKVVNDMNEKLEASLKIIFIALGSFFILLGVLGFILTIIRLPHAWEALKFIFSGAAIKDGIFVIFFLILSFLISIGDIIAGVAIINQKKWSKTIILFMVVMGFLLLLLSFLYLGDIIRNSRGEYKGYIPHPLGAIFRIIFYIIIAILIFKNHDIITGKKKNEEESDTEDSE